MHIGNFLKNEAQRQRLSTSDIGKEVNKTPQAVRKDFEKEELHMSVLESFAKALKINIYEVLAKEWSGSDTNSHIQQTPENREVADQERDVFDRKIKSNNEKILITFEIPATKKEALLKLLTS